MIIKPIMKMKAWRDIVESRHWPSFVSGSPLSFLAVGHRWINQPIELTLVLTLFTALFKRRWSECEGVFAKREAVLDNQVIILKTGMCRSTKSFAHDLIIWISIKNRNVPCYKRCKQMEYKASQELLLDSEDPEVSFWISLTDETYFNSFEWYIFPKGRLGGHSPFCRGGRRSCTGGLLYMVSFLTAPTPLKVWKS